MKFGTYSWVPNRRPNTPPPPPSCLLIFRFFSIQNILFPHPLPSRLLIIGESFQHEFETTYLCWIFCDHAKGVTVLFCKFMRRSQHSVLFCKLAQRSQLIANCWPQFAKVIECLMFLLNVLLGLTDEFDEFCRSFATQNTSASIYYILRYLIKFLLPTRAINFSFFIPPPTSPPPSSFMLLLSSQE